MEAPTWFDLGPDYGVLELNETETLSGFTLELHLVIDSETDATIAWWATDSGSWLVAVRLGQA